MKDGFYRREVDPLPQIQHQRRVIHGHNGGYLPVRMRCARPWRQRALPGSQIHLLFLQNTSE